MSRRILLTAGGVVVAGLAIVNPLAVLLTYRPEEAPGALMQLFWSGLLALGAAGLLRAARRPKWDALSDMKRLVTEGTAMVPAEEPPEAAAYARLSDSDLLDVHDHLSRDVHPERLRALLWVMSLRIKRATASPA
jgi:hypothetical protein